MSTYTGDTLLNTSLTVQRNKPLDDRLVVSNITDLYNINYSYNGMIISCLEDNGLYMLIDNSNKNKAQGWVKIGTIDQQAISNIVNTILIDNYVTGFALNSILADYVQSSDLNGYVQQSDLNNTLEEYVQSSALENYIQKSNTQGLIKHDGTIDDNQYITQTQLNEALANYQPSVNHVILTQSEYDALQTKDNNTIYIIVAGNSSSESWTFGDNFPIVFS